MYTIQFQKITVSKRFAPTHIQYVCSHNYKIVLHKMNYDLSDRWCPKIKYVNQSLLHQRARETKLHNSFWLKLQQHRRNNFPCHSMKHVMLCFADRLRTKPKSKERFKFTQTVVTYTSSYVDMCSP